MPTAKKTKKPVASNKPVAKKAAKQTALVKPISTLGDVKLDTGNTNMHTPAGMNMLRESVERFGFGRSVVVDKNGRLIAGEATTETARELGADNLIVVPSDGKKLVVVQRLDLDLEDDANGKAHGLSVADNVTARVNFNLDFERVRAVTDKHASAADFLPEWIMVEIEQAATNAPSLVDDPGDGRDEEKRQALSDVGVVVDETTTIGSFRFVVPRDAYIRFVEDLRTTAGMRKEDQIALIREKLGF